MRWLVVLALVGCRFDVIDGHASTTMPGSAPAAPAAVVTTTPAVAGWSEVVPAVAEAAVKSVVNVSVTRKPGAGPELAPWVPPFFGPPGEGPSERSLGSGVIVDAAGVVLTNHHVVEDAAEIEVSIAGERGTRRAELVGSDPKTDLAVLRIVDPPAGLAALPYGDDASLRLGELVLAIGDPFGVGQTVTMGIVSGKGRTRVGITDHEDFIQTDAAINPGNSGGALVNLRGELIGINTAIVSRGGGSNGVGFAIPVSLARPIAAALLEHGKVERGRLGVVIQDLDPVLARALDLPAGAVGVVVAEVEEGSPAASAGLRPGDVLLSFQGRPVEDVARFRNAVAAAGPTDFALEVRRGDRTERVEGRLALADEDGGPTGDTPDAPGGRGPAGLALAPLDPDLRQQLRVPDDVDGVVITRVEPDGPAARAGLRRGDVVVEVDRERVTRPQDVARRLRGGGAPALLRVWSQGRWRYVAVE